MMEKDNMHWYAMSDPALLKDLGYFIQQTRLRQNKTQQQVATHAGINRSTLIQMENGGRGTLLSFVQVLRTLQQLHLFKHFEITTQISPLLLAKAEHEKRRRASNKRGKIEDKPKSDW